MKYFKLPDLGEGLQDAEVVEWHVKVGDKVVVDQALVSVETAKAIVDIPCPQDGIIINLFCQAGETLHIGEPLVEFDCEDDGGTVVGEMKTAQENDSTSTHSYIIGSVNNSSSKMESNFNATPAIRALAARLKVDLNQVKPSGAHQLITSEDVEKAHQNNIDHGSPNALKGVTKFMAKNMAIAHAEVAQVSLFDDANISLWPEKEDTIIRLINAIAFACEKEPKFNAKYDGERLSLQTLKTIDLGIAVDTEHGLFVPVLRDISTRSNEDLSQGLKRLRQDVESRSIPPKELIGASISLSNFGNLGGRYATPIVMPPSVAILGAGRAFKAALVVDDTIKIQTQLPLSLSFDHRPITGGEAARFLQAVKHHLELGNPN